MPGDKISLRPTTLLKWLRKVTRRLDSIQIAVVQWIPPDGFGNPGTGWKGGWGWNDRVEWDVGMLCGFQRCVSSSLKNKISIGCCPLPFVLRLIKETAATAAADCQLSFPTRFHRLFLQFPPFRLFLVAQQSYFSVVVTFLAVLLARSWTN